MLDVEHMTAGDLSVLISGDAGGNTYSTKFGKSVYGTLEFNLGKYKSQQKHLLDVLDSVEDSRPLRDILFREENPAQVLCIIEALDADEKSLKKAFDAGAEAWRDAVDSLGVSAACAKSAAAIRATIYGKHSDDSDLEAAA